MNPERLPLPFRAATLHFATSFAPTIFTTVYLATGSIDRAFGAGIGGGLLFAATHVYAMALIRSAVRTSPQLAARCMRWILFAQLSFFVQAGLAWAVIQAKPMPH